MLINEFAKMVEELSNYYERKEPKQQAIELWFDKIKNIPSITVSWITKRLTETYDSFPKNLPMAVYSLYYEWQQSNTDKIIGKSYFDCPDCNEGLIFASKVKNKVQYKYVFRCLKCKQSHVKEYPMASRIELLENYQVEAVRR